MNDLIGQVINNFEIQEMIGQGGMGIVYRAYHPELQRYAAVKIMRPELASQPGFYERFLQEARAAAHLDHPNIVDVINFGRYEESYYLMMDFIEGPNLRQLIVENQEGLPIWDVIQIFLQIAEVLVFAHNAGMLHRDLKPDNILLTSSLKPSRPYRAVVTDFGLVKLAHNSILETQAGISIGTPAYMSPEQCRSGLVDGRADLYSVGVMLYESIIGRRPYPIRNLFDAARFHNSGKLVPLRAHNQAIPIQLDALVRRMLATEVEKRPVNAAEVVQTLQKIITVLESQQEPPISEVQKRIDVVLGRLIDTLDAEEAADSDEDLPDRGPQDSQLTPSEANIAPAVTPTEYYIQVIYHDQIEEKSYPLGSAPLLVGRIPPADMVLDQPERYVSKQHCEILQQGNRVLVRDLGSTNGTFLGENRLDKDLFYEWNPEVTIHLGPFTLALKMKDKPVIKAAKPIQNELDVATTKVKPLEALVCLEAVPAQLPFTARPIIIGRDPDCDMVLNYAQVSKRHCQVQRRGEQVEIMDLNSTNGTYLQGQRLSPNVPITWDTSIPFIIGPATFTLSKRE